MPQKSKWFVLTVVDHDKKAFTIEGPMSDDKAWSDAVVEAQNAGRNIRCYSGDGTLANPAQAAEEWLQEYPSYKQMPQRSLISP